MNTHETYVSLEVAKLLKQAGFDWKCRKCYNNGVLFDMESDEIREQCPQHSSYDVLAPTLDVAQRWLREVKKYHIYVRPYSLDDETYVTNIVVTDSIWGALQDDSKKAIIFNTYEEALEAGIKTCLRIILKEE